MKLDGRVISTSQIKGILAATHFDGNFQPKFLCIHNTSVPDIALFNHWKAVGKPTFEQWLQNLGAYYAGLGWNSMPHAFVAPDGRIGLGAPFNVSGTHSPSWNRIAIGIETVGEFERETFDGTPSQTALVALAGELHKRLGLEPDHYIKGVRGIHFHKEDLASSHRTCPGKHLEKPKFVADVLAYMGLEPEDSNVHATVPIASQEAETPSLTSEQMTSAVWLQERLNAHGAALTIDGKVGDNTKNAVRVFQQSKGLTVDGIAGPLTRLALAS